MAATILEPLTDGEILHTHAVMRQLRPAVAPESYVGLIRGLMTREGYRLVALVEEGQVRAVAGYRFMEMLYCGRILYVDDLVTDEQVRSRGFGRHLLEWLKDTARARGCAELHLDSGVQREAAHRFYLREGLARTSYHFALVL